MAPRKAWTTDELIKMTPVKDDDLRYGYEIFNLYAASSLGLWDIFKRGVSGLCLGDDDPKGFEELEKIMGSGMFSRPEDYGHGKINYAPMLSSGTHIRVETKHPAGRSFRSYKAIRLQGDLEALVMDDYPEEGTGTIAVAICHWLARNGYIPCEQKDAFILHSIVIDGMHPDDDHEKPWLAVEIDLYVHNKAHCAIGLPYSKETGFIDISLLETMSQARGKEKA